MDTNSGGASVSVSSNGSDSVLTLRGAFQLELARPLHEAALQIAETAGHVVVECGEAAHLDGCAVQVLLALKLALDRAGGSLRISGASEAVHKYLGWAGLAAHFPNVEASGATGVAAPAKRRRATRKRSL